MPESDLPYPAHWEADVVLRDGGVVHLRPIRPDDALAVEAFHAGQSAESIYLRFFARMRTPSDDLVERSTVVDYQDHLLLVVTVRDKPIGYARLARLDDASAEVA